MVHTCHPCTQKVGKEGQKSEVKGQPRLCEALPPNTKLKKILVSERKKQVFRNSQGVFLPDTNYTVVWQVPPELCDREVIFMHWGHTLVSWYFSPKAYHPHPIMMKHQRSPNRKTGAIQNVSCVLHSIQGPHFKTDTQIPLQISGNSGD